MSFSNLNRTKLVEASTFFGVDIGENDTRAQIIAALEEDGVTWSSYKKFLDNDKEEETWQNEGGRVDPEDETSVANSNAYETKPEAKDTVGPAAEAAQAQFNRPVLLKMERKNATYQILGRKFTRDQPFQVMTEDEAQQIIDTAEREGGGFRIATPAEAKSYFG